MVAWAHWCRRWKRILLEKLQFVFQWGVTIDKEHAVGRMVVVFMKVAELLIAQIGNIFRITARFMGIGRAGHQTAEDMVKDIANRVGESPFHLIVHHALILEGLFRPSWW